uniref:Uncharacterized protein n=1 Tax=Trichogramma kaykai TaxID=54128 RepID=A0ABD2W9T9_9HYME
MDSPIQAALTAQAVKEQFANFCSACIQYAYIYTWLPTTYTYIYLHIRTRREGNAAKLYVFITCSSIYTPMCKRIWP